MTDDASYWRTYTLAQAGMESSPYDNASSALLVVAPKVYELNTLFVLCSASCARPVAGNFVPFEETFLKFISSPATR
jgi:hypothetical protein